MNMSQNPYNWKRFWCPREGNINLSDGGFLYDPDSDFGHAINPDLVSIDSIIDIQCLILLGEPGIGKSTAIEIQLDSIEQKIKSTDDEILFIDLAEYGDETRLITDIFESDKFISWVNGKHKLHIFIDSFDECLLEIKKLGLILIKKLTQYPLERLYLRICSRTADWPISFEKELKKLWKENSIGIYELSPLRRIDVIEAAKAEELNQDEFMEEIFKKEIVPFAIIPITLRTLLSIYKKETHLPSSRTELYYKGCKTLCEEPNEFRRDSKITGSLNSEKKLMVASRIAAITIFSNKAAVYKGLDVGDIPKEDVYYRDLCGGFESINIEQVTIDENVIQETLATGLFSSRGPHRMGWSHQTYAEFLSAYYLIKNNMDIEQIFSVIKHPNSTEGKLIPQLHETAAWLVGMKPELFKNILSVNPEVLFKSDMSNIDKKDKKDLVNKYLSLLEKEILYDKFEFRLQYHKLNHPDLSNQLKEYICDSSKGTIVRRAATDIAEACKLKSLQKHLAKIALNQSEDYPIRVNAAYAVVIIGDYKTKKKLKPLALGQSGEDPDDELKGCALKALWPKFLTLKKLLKSLTQPKKHDLFGVYKIFIYEDILPHLKTEDLPAVLKWIENKGWNKIRKDPFKNFTKDIFILSWKNLDKLEVLKAFSKLIFSLIINHHNVVGTDYYNQLINLLESELDKRRILIKTIIPLISKSKDKQKILDMLSPIFIPLTTYDDLSWSIDQFNSASNDLKPLWVEFIDNSFDRKDSESIEKIYESHKKNQLLEERFKDLFKEIDLDSTEAKQRREYYNKYFKKDNITVKAKFLSPSPKERISKLLNDFENGNYNAWWQLCQVLTLKPNSTHFENETEADLTILPCWKSADNETKARILSAAKVYIENEEPNNKKLFDNNTWYNSYYAGYKAIVLIRRNDKNYLSSISKNTWGRWAPVIINYPTYSGDDKNLHQELVKIAYKNAPEEIIEHLLKTIDKENEAHNFIDSINKVKNCWDARLAKVIHDKIKDKKLKPESFGNLLLVLLEYGYNDSKVYAESLVKKYSDKNDDNNLRSIVAATELMVNVEGASWSVIWPIINKSIEFGKEIVSKFAYRHDYKVFQNLNEEQLAEFYIWLVNQYPYDEDPKIKGVHSVGIREAIGYFRDYLLNHLKSLGTNEAYEAIIHINESLPNLKFLYWHLISAQDITLQSTWVPHQPEHILKLASNNQLRLIDNGNQLLEVIIESLKRLEKKLHGVTPSAKYLWNKYKYNVWIPRDEPDFSDYVKIHLNDDVKHRGIILNREVEIDMGIGPGTGMKTDIKVDVIKLDQNNNVSYDPITVIIEVKGCWNKELLIAMETQLFNRYMKQNNFNYGLYLVGWFNCDKWDDSDSRKKNANKYNLGELKEELYKQSKNLLQNNIIIKSFVLDASLP